MEGKKLTQNEKQKAVNYWEKSAQEDLKTAESLFNNKRYHHCLFFCHLFLEKSLKALVVQKTSWHTLPIHNLIKLARDADIKLDEELKKGLAIINEFNIRARYNDYKREFYNKATPEYTEEWFTKCKEVYQCLNNQLNKK